MTSMGVWAIDCALTCMIEGKEGRADVQKAIKNIENEGHTLVSVCFVITDMNMLDR